MAEALEVKVAGPHLQRPLLSATMITHCEVNLLVDRWSVPMQAKAVLPSMAGEISVSTKKMLVT